MDRLLRTSRLSKRAIAQQLGVPEHHVENYFVRSGIKRRLVQMQDLQGHFTDVMSPT